MQYVRPFLLISPLSIIVTNVSSQFSTSQLCKLIVLADSCGRQIVVSMHKKLVYSGDLARH